MKVIFLDIDGVLNSTNWHARQHALGHPDPWPLGHLDPDAVAVLNDVIKKTSAHVVVSSTWRRLAPRTQLSDWLRQKGFESDIVSTTPMLNDKPRGLEIQQWLDESPLRRRYGAVKQFVILDDDTDMEHLYPKLVHIDYATGLTRDHVPAIVEHLSGKPVCGCHCAGGCCDPYAPCARPCKDHVPL